ncbi:hypothetical protein HMPREF9394_1438 [Streptococcus sanguinis SK1057]|nr:hypothetical protein HMPREF9394_1438 [Streptococcus sanguinis SK1057]
MKSQQTNLKSLLHLKQAFSIPMIVSSSNHKKHQLQRTGVKIYLDLI